MAIVVGTDTYVTVAAADTYFTHSFRAMTAWAALTTAEKEAALVSAFRIIESQTYEGEPTDVAPTQTAEFPRTGLTDKDDEEVASDSVPDEVETAQFELAYEITQNATAVEGGAGTDSNDKRLKAGSAEIEFFRPVGGVAGGATRFPPKVQELLDPFLLSSTDFATIVGPTAYGTDVESQFDDEDIYGLTEGLP